MHKIAFQDLGIIFSNNEEHHKIHRIVALTGLMKTSVLRHTAETIVECTESFFNYIAKSNPPNNTIDVPKEIGNLTMDIIGKSAFSEDLGAIEGKQVERKQLYGKVFAGLLFFARMAPFMRKLRFKEMSEWKAAIKQAHNLGLQMIEDRRKSGKKFGDFLDYLMEEIDPR
jgi:cytochrome P450